MDPKTYLIVLHLFGLVIGLGSVTTLDFYLLRFLRGDVVSESDARLVQLVSYLAAAGLGALWISGLGFLTLAWLNDPALLANPKLHAKLVVVAILTANGAILHFKVLPMIGRAVGGALFCQSGSRSDRTWMRACGAISAASWWTPFVLGAVRELNFAAPIHVFLGGYAVVLIVFGAGFTAAEEWLSRHGKRRRAREAAAASRSPAPLRFIPLPAHHDAPGWRSLSTNEETRHVAHNPMAFAPRSHDHPVRSARERLRDYHAGPERSGESLG